MFVTMTDKDLYRLGIIQRVHDHTLLQRDAARLLELNARQIHRVEYLTTMRGAFKCCASTRSSITTEPFLLKNIKY